MRPHSTIFLSVLLLTISLRLSAQGRTDQTFHSITKNEFLEVGDSLTRVPGYKPKKGELVVSYFSYKTGFREERIYRRKGYLIISRDSIFQFDSKQPTAVMVDGDLFTGTPKIVDSTVVSTSRRIKTKTERKLLSNLHGVSGFSVQYDLVNEVEIRNPKVQRHISIADENGIFFGMSKFGRIDFDVQRISEDNMKMLKLLIELSEKNL